MSQQTRLARLEAAAQRGSKTAGDSRRELYRRFARIRAGHELHAAAGELTGPLDLARLSKAERLALGDKSFGRAELQAHVDARWPRQR